MKAVSPVTATVIIVVLAIATSTAATYFILANWNSTYEYQKSSSLDLYVNITIANTSNWDYRVFIRNDGDTRITIENILIQTSNGTKYALSSNQVSISLPFLLHPHGAVSFYIKIPETVSNLHSFTVAIVTNKGVYAVLIQK